MSETSKVWNGYVHTFDFAGIDCTQGSGKKGFLELTQVDDAVTIVKGTDGSLVFNQMPDGAMKISATYLQTSKTNALLTAYYNGPQRLGVVGALNYQDRNGTGKVIAGSAMIVKQPDEPIGGEVDDVTWDFLVADYVRLVGSH